MKLSSFNQDVFKWQSVGYLPYHKQVCYAFSQDQNDQVHDNFYFCLERQYQKNSMHLTDSS